ncbi:hypothetical protein L3Q82_016616 [Scortum barcoo]|uniref:Uncharacterized protein n=1 Tax=Scortum barcoo TaxID=214431 RepID=A0ACB8X885_9TELE|nr:hypothetical protein L3Q82_016616 [Scortum barcoo]
MNTPQRTLTPVTLQVNVNHGPQLQRCPGWTSVTILTSREFHLAIMISKRYSASPRPPLCPLIALGIAPSTSFRGELLPILKARLYTISGPERRAMDDYIEASLRTGIIRPSSSPAVGFFFVGKKDGTLQPCIDYSALSDITVKNQYPLPLQQLSAFELLQQARVFTKVDLGNA